MIYLIVALATLALFAFFMLRLPQFGQMPQQERKKAIEQLANYKSGEIQNLSYTPAKADNISWASILFRVIKGNEKSAPKYALPTQMPNFNRTDNLKITWFGHSSYLLQVDGKNILVDPVFSKRTSPFSFLGTKNFMGTDFINVEDLPPIDVMVVTHDHYDHLDYNTVLKVKSKVGQFVTSLGVGQHLERWGISKSLISELAWHSTAQIAGLSFTAVPGRHFSGRGFKRNQSLWSAFVLKTSNNNLFLGGDSGYDKHFKAIGDQFGPFDLAILECGQYNEAWPYIHMFPSQVLLAATDLRATKLLPVHWAKFKLALHDWNEPIKQLINASKHYDITVMKPMLGQSFTLDQSFENHWWEQGPK